MKFVSILSIVNSIDLADKYARQEFLEKLETTLSEIKESDSNNESSPVSEKLNTLSQMEIMVKDFRGVIEDSVPGLQTTIIESEEIINDIQVGQSNASQNVATDKLNIQISYNKLWTDDTSLTPAELCLTNKLNNKRTEHTNKVAEVKAKKEQIAALLIEVNSLENVKKYYSIDGNGVEPSICDFTFTVDHTSAWFEEHFYEKALYSIKGFESTDEAYDSKYQKWNQAEIDLGLLETQFTAIETDYIALISKKNSETINWENLECELHTKTNTECGSYVDSYEKSIIIYNESLSTTKLREQQNIDDIHNINMIYCHIKAYLGNKGFFDPEFNISNCVEDENANFDLVINYIGVTDQKECPIHPKKDFCGC